MVERIKQIMEYYHLSPASFAEQIGINRSNLTHLFSGRNQPSLELAKKILYFYPDIKPEWLIMGVGNMFKNNADKELQVLSQNERKKYEEQKEVDLFSSLPTSTDKRINTGESRTAEKKENNVQISDSREIEEKMPTIISEQIEKKILTSQSATQVVKIVFFYSDNSFEVFHPNKK